MINVALYFHFKNKFNKFAIEKKQLSIKFLFLILVATVIQVSFYALPTNAMQLTPKLISLINNAEIYFGPGKTEVTKSGITLKMEEVTILLRQKDIIDLIKENMPSNFDGCSKYKIVAKMRACGHVWNFHNAKFKFNPNRISFTSKPDYRVEKDIWIITHVKWKWRGFKSHLKKYWNWKNIARKSGKVDVSGTANIHLKNPGASFPEAIITVEIKSGEPNIKKFPNWAEKHLKFGGKSVRERIKEVINSSSFQIPISKITGIEKLKNISINSLSFTPAGDKVKVRMSIDIKAE